MKLHIRLFARLTISGALAASVALGADWKMLPGHVPLVVSKLTALGPLPATNQMRLAIGLPLRDPAGLSNFVADVGNPASPHYHHYLTRDQLTARFGPTEQDYEAVKQFARTNGLTVAGTFGNRLVLDVTGPASAVEKAWRVTFHIYQHPTEARRFFAPDSEPTVAAGLPVVDIQGLTDYSRPHAKLHQNDLAQAAIGKGGSAPDGSGGFFGNDFRNAYVPGTPLTGAGQIVGLLQFDGFYSNDIAAYAEAAGNGRASIPIETVLLDGYDGTPTMDGGNSEVSLDIEMSMSMAPGLDKIVVFEAGPYGEPNDLLNAMLSYTNTIRQLSCSWGWSGGPSTTTEAIFQSMDAMGQSFFDASGDSDAFTAGADSVNGVDNPSLDNVPSSSPYITQVGATTLTMNGTGSAYASETVWNWGIEIGASEDGVGSSGGVSSYYAMPWWQTNVSNMAARGGSAANRNIPDVALTGDNVYVVSGGDQSVGNFGGTSCAAPLWAGFMALVNQQTTESGGPSAGFINPAIYTLAASDDYASCFHDVTTGNNTWSESPDLFYATNGYDLCTGLGTPNGAGLIAALGADTLAFSAGGGGYDFKGPFGGPFTPGAATFTLTNTSSATLRWTLANSANWLVADSVGGALPAHTTANVDISLVGLATNLPTGGYVTSLAFSNCTTHVLHRVSAALDVEEALAVSPARGFSASGPLGGPFISSAQTFILTNLGGGTLNWSIVNTSAWLSASALVGSLAAHGQASVLVTTSTAASTIVSGDYESSLVFGDQGNTVATVPFGLSVGQLVLNGGFETGDFSGWALSGITNYTFVTNVPGAFVQFGSCGAVLGTTPSPGYLAQNVVTTPGQGYVLSFWLCNPTGGSLNRATPNRFQALWNGAVIFAETNVIATTWTRHQFNVTATGTATPIEFCFQDVPAYLALDGVSVIESTNAATAATAITGLTATVGTGVQLNWNAVSGDLYQVQYKTNLSQPDWIDLGNPVTASGAACSLTDSTGLQAAPQRFYRISRVP